jgi:hypothetical protein
MKCVLNVGRILQGYERTIDGKVKCGPVYNNQRNPNKSEIIVRKC